MSPILAFYLATTALNINGGYMKYKIEFYAWVKEKGAKMTLEEFTTKWEEIETKRIEAFGIPDQLNKGRK
jgi:hypothetical protein